MHLKLIHDNLIPLNVLYMFLIIFIPGLFLYDTIIISIYGYDTCTLIKDDTSYKKYIYYTVLVIIMSIFVIVVLSILYLTIFYYIHSSDKRNYDSLSYYVKYSEWFGKLTYMFYYIPIITVYIQGLLRCYRKDNTI